MYLKSFSGIDLPLNATTNDIPASVSLSRMGVSGALIGGYILGAQHDPRKYSLSGVYLRDSVRPYLVDQRLQSLRATMGNADVLTQQMRDGSVRRCTAYLTSLKILADQNSTATSAQGVTMDFETGSFWFDDTETVYTFTSKNKFYLLNSGNVNSNELRFEVTSSIASSLVITNETNGMALTYGAAKSNGVELVIDCAKNIVTADGVNVYTNISRADTQIELMAISAGLNVISTNIAVTGEVRYRGAYI